MPISFVGSYAGTHAATTAQTVLFSNLRDESNAQPTLAQNDIVVVAVENASTVDRTTAQLTPSGYTAAHTDDYQNDSNDSNFLVSYKFMGATPDTSVAIPASNATTAGVGYAIYVFRGVDTTTPLDVSPVVTGGTNTGVANAAAITPASSGAWIAAFAGAAVAAGAVFTNPAGMSTTTNHFRSATITTTTNDANIGGALYTGWTSGSYDPAAFGGSTSTNTGSWSAVTIALRPFVATTVVTITAGSVTLTGEPVSTVLVARKEITPASESYSGQSVVSNARQNITVSEATLALTPQTVFSRTARTVQVSAGAVSVLPQSFNINRKYLEVLSQGTITLSGQPIVVNARRSVTITIGSMTYTGEPVSTKTNTSVSILNGTETYTGQPIVVTNVGGGASGLRPRKLSISISLGL